MELKQLNLSNLTKDDFKVYENLTEKENTCYLYQKNPYNIEGLTYIAFTAIEDNRPIALLLATGSGGDHGVHHADVRSLFVQDKSLKREIGIELIQALEILLRKGKCLIVNMIYETNHESKDLELVLEKCGWKTPTPLIYRYYFKPAVFKPVWFLKNYSWPLEFSLFFWKELTLLEKKELQRREDQWNFPSRVSPLLNDENIEYSNSLGVKLGNRIIGWIITHKLNENTIRYSSLYIQPEYRFLGLAIQLLIKSIKIQKQMAIEHHPLNRSVFDLNIAQTSPIWQQFIKRRLAPYAERIIVLNHIWKDLSK